MDMEDTGKPTAQTLATRSHFYAVRGISTSSFEEGSQDDLTLPYPCDRSPRSHAPFEEIPTGLGPRSVSITRRRG